MLIFWFGFWDLWNLYHKVTFDGENRLILINDGETDIDVQTDIYSDWKEWFMVYDNSKWVAALRTVGGDPISDTRRLGDTYFLINDWKIKPWRGEYRLIMTGNLYCDDGSNPILSADRPSNILIQSHSQSQDILSIVNKLIQFPKVMVEISKE